MDVVVEFVECGVGFGEAVDEVAPWSLGSFRQAGYTRVLPLSHLLPWRLIVTFDSRPLWEEQLQNIRAYCGYRFKSVFDNLSPTVKHQIEPSRCSDPRINLPQPPLRLWHPDGQNIRHRQVCSNHCDRFYLVSRAFGVVENLLVLLLRPMACSKCLRRLHIMITGHRQPLANQYN